MIELQEIKEKVIYLDSIDSLSLLLSKTSSSGKTFNDLVSKYKSCRRILELDIKELVSNGLEEEDALYVKAIHNITKGYFELEKRVQIYSPRDIKEYLLSNLNISSTENLSVFLLDRYKGLLHKEILFTGTADDYMVYPREIMKLALLHNATYIIIVHNTIQYDYIPSYKDTSVTNQLKDLAEKFNIQLLDHLIVTKEKVYSVVTSSFI